jgi:hypothetical protein
MSAGWPRGETPTPGSRSEDFDDAEKGMYDSTQSLPASPPLAHLEKKAIVGIEGLPSPISPVHEGITPASSVPVLSLSGTITNKTSSTTPLTEKPARTKPKTSRWILFQLWFNTYRKFFILTTSLNLIGMVMAAVGRFDYAQGHLGALVLGNLLFAVLMRNELFLRILYTIAIYGLRSVSLNYTASQTDI